MPLTRARLDGVAFFGRPRTFSAVSSCLGRVGGDGWVAVGDAAASHDPLSSPGIPHAMGSGTQGALVAANTLFADGRALEAYQEAVRADFLHYLRTHWQSYQRETRWPDAPFWQRRRTAVAVKPDATVEEITGRREIDFTETVHLPPRLSRELYQSVQPGRPAHEIVRAFAEAHPQVS